MVHTEQCGPEHCQNQRADHRLQEEENLIRIPFIGTDCLKRVTNFRYLGLHVDDDLSLNTNTKARKAGMAAFPFLEESFS